MKSYHWIQQEPRRKVRAPMQRKTRITSLFQSAFAVLSIAGLTSSCGRASPAAPPVAEIARRSLEGNAALLRGDVARYRALVPLTDDFTLMSPFGATPSRASQLTEERWDSMTRFFRNGTLEVELVETYASPDMVVLAVIEHAHVEVGGLPAQDWSLRVTLVYRRVGREWRLAHRHADPLVHGVTLQQAAALARGVTEEPR
jgi:ketosteroid isomerase-like protein